MAAATVELEVVGFVVNDFAPVVSIDASDQIKRIENVYLLSPGEMPGCLTSFRRDHHQNLALIRSDLSILSRCGRCATTVRCSEVSARPLKAGIIAEQTGPSRRYATRRREFNRSVSNALHHSKG